jgi:hypothetical protein
MTIAPSTRVLDPLKRLFRACEPDESLGPEDPRYINCDIVRGENLPLLYARSLYHADPLRPEVKVFAGHRGVGKTSELKRLRHMLENPKEDGDRPFQVLFMDVSRTLDLNDLDFPDLLVFVAAEAQRQLREAEIPGFSPVSTLLQRVWEEIRRLPDWRASLTGVDIEIPFTSLAVELRNQPTSRSRLREEIEKRSTSLFEAVNDILTTAAVRLREDGKEGLVLIVDGLDKLVRRGLEDGGNTHDRLFIHRSDQLASLRAHVIYTVPISLIYSPQFTQLEQTFGGHQSPVPMIRLRDSDRSDPSPNTLGMKKMREIIEARCRYAEVNLGDVFDSPETCHYLCEMTGGHPRHLMMFLQAAANRVDRLPITRDAAEKAIRAYANSLLREVPDDFWPKLRQFATPQDDISKDDIHQQMLLLLHVFEYMNGQPWYEVNPVLRTLPKFRG